jgi:hypothetical protein
LLGVTTSPAKYSQLPWWDYTSQLLDVTPMFAMDTENGFWDMDMTFLTNTRGENKKGQN